MRGSRMIAALYVQDKGCYDPAVVARMGLKRAKRLGEVGARGGGTNSTPRISTPTPFRDLLISIAKTAPFVHDKL